MAKKHVEISNSPLLEKRQPYSEYLEDMELWHDRAVLHDQLGIPPCDPNEMDYIRNAEIDIFEKYGGHISYEHILESQLPAGAIIGGFFFGVPHKVRYVRVKEVEMAPGVGPRDVTRAWINDKFTVPMKRRKSQIESSYRAPLLARIGEWGDCCYVDIVKSYVRILSLGFDLEYEMGRYVGARPQPVPVVIRSNKLCYSIGVSMSSTKIASIDIMTRKGVPFTTHPFNVYSNPCLYNLAMDTLSAMAANVIEIMGVDVKYVNTDGYIVPSEVREVVQAILLEWGFESKVKHWGETKVFGVGSYEVGRPGEPGYKKTVKENQNGIDFQSKMPDPMERLWLKYQWQKWDKYII